MAPRILSLPSHHRHRAFINRGLWRKRRTMRKNKYNKLSKRSTLRTPCQSSEVEVEPCSPTIYQVGDQFACWVDPDCFLETSEDTTYFYNLPENYDDLILYIEGEPVLLKFV